jgi:ADP-heptose:LPS heptosyltransferase
LHAELARAIPAARFPLQEAQTDALGREPFLTMALARRAHGALANDSGNAHILAAAGVPLVVIFGPTSAEKFVPVGSHVRVVRASDHGGRLADLPSSAVLTALQAALETQARG